MAVILARKDACNWGLETDSKLDRSVASSHGYLIIRAQMQQSGADQGDIWRFQNCMRYHLPCFLDPGA